MRFVRCFWGRLDRAYFLGTNSNTAQGRPGNLYLDEYFWIPGFKKLRRIGYGVANPLPFDLLFHPVEHDA